MKILQTSICTKIRLGLGLVLVLLLLPWQVVAGDGAALDQQLIEAAGNGDVATVKNLLDKGGAVDAKDKTGGTVLMEAAAAGHLEIVSLLTEAGADVNARNRFDRTALIEAARRGRVEVVRLLLEKGADVNAKGLSRPAMDEALRADSGEAKRIALTGGRRTALMEAASRGHLETASLLVDRGADVNAKDRDGWTALARAQRRGVAEIVQLLKAHGARE